jgi:uncharacterized protein YkwD
MGRIRFAVLLSFALLLSACLGFGGGSNVMYVDHPSVDRPATVNPGAAAAMISAYRNKTGLGSVTVDPTLSAIAAKHARAMASQDLLAHVLPGEGSFAARLAAGGYDAAYAAENVGAGYHDLDEAFAGWKQSPPHRANMLNRNVDRIGIAVAYNKGSKFRDYWCLVLAKPDERKMAAGPGPAAQ